MLNAFRREVYTAVTKKAISGMLSLLHQTSECVVAWIDRKPVRALILIALLMVSLDACKLWKSRYAIVGYGGLSWDIARNLMDGKGYTFIVSSYFPFSGPTNKVSAAREPVPVLLFATVGLLTQGSSLALGFFQIGVSLMVLFGTFALARHIAGERVALLCALAWALYPPAMREMLDKEVDLIAALLVVWGMVLFVRAQSRATASSWIAAGLVFGLAVLSRSAFLMVVLVLAVGLVLASSRGTERWKMHSANLRAATLFLVAFGVV
jgi:hypothetical protein